MTNESPAPRHLAEDISLSGLVRRQWPLVAMATGVEGLACAHLILIVTGPDLSSLGLGPAPGMLLAALALLSGPVVLLAERAPAIATLVLLTQLVPLTVQGEFTAAHVAAMIVTGILVAHHRRYMTALVSVYWLVSCLLVPWLTGHDPTTPAIVLMVATIAMMLGMMAREWSDARFLARVRHDSARRAQRTFIGRSVHDSLAHDNTRMVLQAERMSQLRHRDPELEQALEEIVSEGREAVVDLAGLLFLTKQSTAAPAELNPDFARALERSRTSLTRAGLQPEVMIDGDVSSMPPLTASAMTRALEEAVVNMAKYAPPGGRCTIMVEITADRAGIMAANDIPSTDDPVRDRIMSSGYGLLALQEHAAALGGDVVYGAIGTRWSLTLSLPLEPGVSA